MIERLPGKQSSCKTLGWTNAKDEPDKRRAQTGMKHQTRLDFAAMDAGSKRFKLTKKGETVSVEAKGPNPSTVPAGSKVGRGGETFRSPPLYSVVRTNLFLGYGTGTIARQYRRGSQWRGCQG